MTPEALKVEAWRLKLKAQCYGCPFAHLLSAHTCCSLKNLIDIIIAAHLKFKPHMWVSRSRKSILLRNYDISLWFCAARLIFMAALLIANFYCTSSEYLYMPVGARLSSELWRKWQSGTRRHLPFTWPYLLKLAMPRVPGLPLKPNISMMCALRLGKQRGIEIII